MRKKFTMSVLVGASLIVPILAFARLTTGDDRLLISIQEQVNVIRAQIDTLLRQQTTASAPTSVLTPTPTPTSASVSTPTPTPTPTPAPIPRPQITPSDIEDLRTQIMVAEVNLQQLWQVQILDKLNQGQNVSPPQAGDGGISRAGLVNEGSVAVHRARVVSVDYAKKTFVAEILQGVPDSVRGFGGKNKQKVFLGFEQRICKISFGSCQPQFDKMSKFEELVVGDFVVVAGRWHTIALIFRKGEAIWNIEANAIYPDQLARLPGVSQVLNPTILVLPQQ